MVEDGHGEQLQARSPAYGDLYSVVAGERAAGGTQDAFALFHELGTAHLNEVDELHQRGRNLERERKRLQKEIKNKQAREARLMHKAAKSLTSEQLVQVASLKAACAAKAKAKAATRAAAAH